MTANTMLPDYVQYFDYSIFNTACIKLLSCPRAFKTFRVGSCSTNKWPKQPKQKPDVSHTYIHL